MLWQLVEGLSWTPSWWDLLIVASYALVLLSVPSVLLQREGNPYSALAWISAMFALPPLGLFLWWAFGRKHLSRKRRERRRAATHIARSLAEVRNDLPAAPPAEFAMLPIQRLPAEDALWVFPPTSSNRVRLLVDACEAYPAMEASIRAARDHIHLLFYIWNDDATGRRFRDMLVEKAKSGVRVRLLVDAFGSPAAKRRFFQPLNDAGGKTGLFLPPKYFTRSPALNFRNHRKLLVTDGQAGFVGGLNIGDEYCDHWHDMAIAIAGPAVDQLQEVFVDDWFFATGEDIARSRVFGRWTEANAAAAQAAAFPPNDEKEEGAELADATCAVIASGPHTPQNSLHDAYFVAITQATKRVYITTPYFIPDNSILAALRTAVYRGVDVRVLLPEKIDVPYARLAARSYYAELLQAGVRIYEYQPSILHAKTAVFDDDISAVGSANVDLRSFRLNFESTCFVQSPSLASQLRKVFERDLRKSRQITLEEMQNRGYWTKLLEAGAHLLSPML